MNTRLMRLMCRVNATVKLHFAVLLFGMAGLAGKVIALPPSYLVLGRTAFGAAAIAGIWLAYVRFSSSTDHAPASTRKRSPKPLDNFFLWLSGPLLALHWWTFFYAIQLSGVGVALVGFSSFPLASLLLEVLARSRSIGTWDGVTTLGVMVGLWLVAPSWQWYDEALQGLVYGILSGVLFALLAWVNQGLVANRGGLSLAMSQQAVAALCCLPWVLWQWSSDMQVSLTQIAGLAGLGILLTALPHTLFIQSLTHVGVHTAAMATSLEPVYGILLAWWLLAEQPLMTTLVGMTIITIAVMLQHVHKKQHQL